MLTINDINEGISQLGKDQPRETMFAFAFALLDWLGVHSIENKKPRLLAPQTQKLKDALAPAPGTVQPQLYRLSADGQHIRARFAVLKTIKKEHILRLVDNDVGLTSYQASMRGIVQQEGREPFISQQPYYIHFITTPKYDQLLVVLNQGDQKRLVSFRNRLTQTQFNKILPKWQSIGSRSKPEIAEILWKSLDLKEINKDFYKLIKEQFDLLIGLAKSQFPEEKQEDIAQFAIRLIGRTIFCWFLKEKGIIPEILLSSGTIHKYKENYAQIYLKHLFFNTLNEEVQSRTPLITGTLLDGTYQSIPYLNGGLFESHDEDRLFDHLSLNDWLIEFVKVLEGFDFTVDESSSQYQQVAIDPEMLGRIFENLLASQNPETEKLANQRKAFGAFYTPREIVDYMVNESLKATIESRLMPPDPVSVSKVEEPVVEYKGTLFQHLEPTQTMMALEPALSDEAEKKRERIKVKIEKLFIPGCLENPFDKEETQAVRKVLSDIVILDPACGSGAFPMGVLLRLMELRQIVGHGHKNNYDLKSEILSKNIFGVDIMPMAVEIARLRAWLSLVLEADYRPADRKNNFGISSLPNLDFKFVCANSLIDSGYDAFLKKFAPQIRMVDSKAYQLKIAIDKLEQLRNDYYDPKGDKFKKKDLQDQFNQTKDYIKKEFQGLATSWNLKDFLNKIDDWTPFNDSHASSFFSPGWMFGINDGFDVVIGNPPYVQMQKDGGKLAKIYEGFEFDTFKRMGDIYSLFYEVGVKFLIKDGILSYITSSQWIRANYGKSMRQYLLTKNPLKLIELGPNIFESAVVDTNILFIKNSVYKRELNGIRIDNPEYLDKLSLLNFQSMSDISENVWQLLNLNQKSINDKFYLYGKHLKEWKITINFGIKTGLNEIFLIDDFKRNELLEIDSTSNEIIRPVLRGREIEEYYTEWDGGYLISTFPSLKINIKDYKAVEKYLEGFRPKINQTGEIFINSSGKPEKSRKKTFNKWFETQDQIGYYQDFRKEKIIWKRIGSQLRFSYSDSEIYSLDSTCIATGEKMKYLTGLLNSKLCKYQLFKNSPKTGMGDLIISVQALEPLLVYYPKDAEEKLIVDLVDEILKIKKEKRKDDISSFKNQIDLLVYKFYHLTYHEVKEVDPDFWLSEGEYERVEVK